MKTLTLRKTAAEPFEVVLKVDIFATIAKMQEPGFDTRFTNMTVEGYTRDAAQVLGNIQEIEYSYQELVKLATDNAGVGLYVADLNDNNGAEVELVAP